MDKPTSGAVVKRFAFSLLLRFFSRSIMFSFGCAAFLSGCLILAGRIAPYRLPGVPPACLTAVFFVIAAAYSALRAFSLVPPRGKLAVCLDAYSRSGGLVAASLETDVSLWRGSIPPLRFPRIETRGRSGVALLAGGVLFLMCASLLPRSMIQPPADRADGVSGGREELEKRIEILKNEKLLPEKTLETLKMAFDSISPDDSANDPARIYETLENLTNKVDSLVSSAISEAENGFITRKMLSETAAALSKAPGASGASKELEQFADLLARMAASDPKLAALLSETGFGDGASNPEKLKELASKLASDSEQLKKILDKLAAAGKKKNSKKNTAKKSQCGTCGRESSLDELAEWLETNAPGSDDLMSAVDSILNGNNSCEECGQCGSCSGPGAGVAGRGRADAPLEYSGGTKLRNDLKRKDLMLEGGREKKKSSLLGYFSSAPEKEEAERAKEGRLTSGKAASARSETILYPEHRAAVRRYFDNTEVPERKGTRKK